MWILVVIVVSASGVAVKDVDSLFGRQEECERAKQQVESTTGGMGFRVQVHGHCLYRR
jgi:hypothetical protein